MTSMPQGVSLQQSAQGPGADIICVSGGWHHGLHRVCFGNVKEWSAAAHVGVSLPTILIHVLTFIAGLLCRLHGSGWKQRRADGWQSLASGPRREMQRGGNRQRRRSRRSGNEPVLRRPLSCESAMLLWERHSRWIRCWHPSGWVSCGHGQAQTEISLLRKHKPVRLFCKCMSTEHELQHPNGKLG